MQISDILKNPDNAPQQLELGFSPRHWGYNIPSQEEISPLVFITEFLLQQNFTFCRATTGGGYSEISHTGDAPYDVCYKDFSSFKNYFVDDFFKEQKVQSKNSGGWISSLNYEYVDVHLMRDTLYLRASVSHLGIVLQWLDIGAGDLAVIQSLWDALCRSFPDSPDNRHSISTSFPLPKKYAKPQPVMQDQPKVPTSVAPRKEADRKPQLTLHLEPTPESTPGINFTWEIKKDQTLIISGNGPMGSPYITHTRTITKDLESFEHEYGNWMLREGDEDTYYTLPWDNPATIQKAQIMPGITSLSTGTFSAFSFAINDHVYHGTYEKLQQIILPNTLTHIFSFAIANCPNLEMVVVPASVVLIGCGTFEQCPKLTIYTTSGSYAEEYARKNGIPVWLLDGPPEQAEPKKEEVPEIAWFPIGISFDTTALRGGWQKEPVYLHDNGTLVQGKIYLGVDDYSFSPAKWGAPSHHRIAINCKATDPLALHDGILTLKTQDGSVCFTIPEELQASLQLWLDEKLLALSIAATLPTVFLFGSDKQICSLHPFLRAHCKDGSRLLQLLRDQFPVFSDNIDWFTGTGSISVEKDNIQFTSLKKGSSKTWCWDESAEHLAIRMEIEEYGFFDDSEYHYRCEFTIRYLGNQPDAEAESLPPLPEKIDPASIFGRRNYYQAHWIAEDPFDLEGFYRITCATGN